MSGWTADSIYVNGKVVTVDARDSIAQALAVKGDRILAVGTNEEIRWLGWPDHGSDRPWWQDGASGYQRLAHARGDVRG